NSPSQIGQDQPAAVWRDTGASARATEPRPSGDPPEAATVGNTAKIKVLTGLSFTSKVRRDEMYFGEECRQRRMQFGGLGFCFFFEKQPREACYVHARLFSEPAATRRGSHD